MDLFTVFDGVAPLRAKNNDDLIYAVSLEDGFSDALAHRPFTAPRESGQPGKEGYAEGFAKGQEYLNGH